MLEDAAPPSSYCASCCKTQGAIGLHNANGRCGLYSTPSLPRPCPPPHGQDAGSCITIQPVDNRDQALSLSPLDGLMRGVYAGMRILMQPLVTFVSSNFAEHDHMRSSHPSGVTSLPIRFPVRFFPRQACATRARPCARKGGSGVYLFPGGQRSCMLRTKCSNREDGR
jgi:hypothetical protein